MYVAKQFNSICLPRLIWNEINRTSVRILLVPGLDCFAVQAIVHRQWRPRSEGAEEDDHGGQWSDTLSRECMYSGATLSGTICKWDHPQSGTLSSAETTFGGNGFFWREQSV